MTDFVSQTPFLLLAAATTLAALGQNVLWSGLGTWIERSRFGRDHRVWGIELAPGQLRWEIAASLRFDAIIGVAIAAALSSGAVRIGATGAAAMAGTFGACWLAFEIYYWLLHRAMHTRPLYRFHRLHHDSRVTTPFTGTSTSAVEALGWAFGFCLAPLVLSVFAPIHLGGFALYLAYNYGGNIGGHVNAEFLPALLRRRANSWLMHPVVYHALHHARFVNHYSFGSSFMDRLMGTEWDDWPALHERVLSGRPMTKLTQRGV